MQSICHVHAWTRLRERGELHGGLTHNRHHHGKSMMTLGKQPKATSIDRKLRSQQQQRLNEHQWTYKRRETHLWQQLLFTATVLQDSFGSVTELGQVTVSVHTTLATVTTSNILPKPYMWSLLMCQTKYSNLQGNFSTHWFHGSCRARWSGCRLCQ